MMLESVLTSSTWSCPVCPAHLLKTLTFLRCIFLSPLLKNTLVFSILRNEIKVKQIKKTRPKTRWTRRFYPFLSVADEIIVFIERNRNVRFFAALLAEYFQGDRIAFLHIYIQLPL